MNYIKEINDFYRRLETNPLSSNAANLWHTFMHVNNRAGWKERFTVAISVLCSKANISASTFKRARAELRDKGYIYYESRGGNRSAIYQVISAEQSIVNHSNDYNEHSSDDFFEPQTADQSKVQSKLDRKPVPLLKLNETKQRTSTAAAEAVDFSKENIGDLQPFIKSDLIKWTNEVGEPLVLTAIKRALERGQGNWGYIKGILQDWSAKGFTKVEETEREVLEFRKGKKRNAWRTSEPRSEEVIPDWFHERHIKREKRVETAAEAKERRELKKLLMACAKT